MGIILPDTSIIALGITQRLMRGLWQVGIVIIIVMVRAARLFGRRWRTDGLDYTHLAVHSLHVDLVYICGSAKLPISPCPGRT